jgi:UDP-N-acetylglucosamine 2-epimerase (non-hydrolysing)
VKIGIILGTRPEIIKMSPIIKELSIRREDFFILHTGQHYSYEMDAKIFDDLDLPMPRYNLNVGGQEYRKQVGMMIREISEILKKEKPTVVIVQGDTNSVLAGAQAANKLGIKIAHHEAGLRSHNLKMLEENNRIITDHISDYLFAPTEDALKNLLEEGIEKSKIFYSGNTIVDAVFENLEISRKKTNILEKLGLQKGNYVLVTAHRAENVDIESRLRGILEGLAKVAMQIDIPVIFPIHPRTLNNLKAFQLPIPEKVRFIEPVGFLEFLQLEANAKLAITDSGGVQEEACILKIPCVTVRDETERPETITCGANQLAGVLPEKILSCVLEMLKCEKTWPNVFGDGKAAKRIVDFLISEQKKSSILKSLEKKA